MAGIAADQTWPVQVWCGKVPVCILLFNIYCLSLSGIQHFPVQVSKGDGSSLILMRGGHPLHLFASSLVLLEALLALR